MTPEEQRLKAFTDAYNALVQEHGIVVNARLVTETFGETMVQTKLIVEPAFVTNWQPALPKDMPNITQDTPPNTNGHRRGNRTKAVQ